MKHNIKIPLAPMMTLLAGLLLAGLLGTTGCRTIKGAPTGSLAAVSITNRPMAEVETAIMTVFFANGYTGGASAADTYTFTKPGGEREKLAYGNSMFDHSLLVKVEVTTVQPATNTVVIACKAWVIEAQDQMVFEETHPVHWLGRVPYEDLLEAVKTRLGQ